MTMPTNALGTFRPKQERAEPITHRSMDHNHPLLRYNAENRENNKEHERSLYFIEQRCSYWWRVFVTLLLAVQ